MLRDQGNNPLRWRGLDFIPLEGNKMSNEKEKVQKIHEATLRILQNTGMKFVHPDAQKILR